MQPKSYRVFKWVVYALATMLLCALQAMFFSNIRILGLTPFLYPMLPAAVAMFEGTRRGAVFALIFGVLCDLLLPAPIPCFYTLVFPLVGLFASLLSHSLLRPGLLCSLASAAMAFALTDGFACFVLWSRGKAAWGAGAFLALREFCVTAPWIIPVTLLFQAVFHRTHPDE